MYLQNFVFLDENSSSTTSNSLVVNSNAETLKLSVITLSSGTTPSITVQGMVDRDAAQWFNLAVIKLADYSVASTITAEGIYAVDAQGVKELRVVSGTAAGSVKVMGVAVAD